MPTLAPQAPGEALIKATKYHQLSVVNRLLSVPGINHLLIRGAPAPARALISARSQEVVRRLLQVPDINDMQVDGAKAPAQALVINSNDITIINLLLQVPGINHMLVNGAPAPAQALICGVATDRLLQVPGIYDMLVNGVPAVARALMSVCSHLFTSFHHNGDILDIKSVLSDVNSLLQVPGINTMTIDGVPAPAQALLMIVGKRL